MATVFVTIVITALGWLCCPVLYSRNRCIDLWESQQHPLQKHLVLSGSIGIPTELMSPNQEMGVLITRRKSSQQF